jgi:hypothetical protein
MGLRFFSLQYRGIHDVDGVTVCVGDDLIEHVRELDLVFVPRHVADVRGADDVVHS